MAAQTRNVGIYRGSGEVREGLVQEILTQIPGEKILWEAPQKAQQLYFIELLGTNVNLGNIAPNEIIRNGRTVFNMGIHPNRGCIDQKCMSLKH